MHSEDARQESPLHTAFFVGRYLVVAGVVLTYGIGILSILLPLPVSLAFIVLSLLVCGIVLLQQMPMSPAAFLLIGLILAISSINAVTSGNTLMGPDSRSNLYPTALVLFGMFMDQRTMKQILKIAFALAVLDCGLALYLYLFNDDRLCLLLATSGSNFNSYYDGSGSRRAFGFSGYSIVTAGNAFFAFLYALWHGINSSGKTWWALLGAIALAALVLTQSRLYVLGGCASAAWILLRHRQASLLRTGFVACALLGVGLAGFSLLDVSDRLDILNHWSFADSDNGFEQHGVFHVDGINAVQENLLGHGPGYASAPDSSSESSGVRRAIVWTESTWLKLAVDEGVPFAILVLLLLGRALRVRPANTYDRSQKPFFALIILSFIGIGISFPIGLNLTNALIPCLLAGYLLRYDGLRHRGHIPQTGQGRGFRMLATR